MRDTQPWYQRLAAAPNTNPRQPSWRDDAACIGDVRFTQEPSPGVSWNNIADELAPVCGVCPVQPECLDAGQDEPTGIWGGTTPDDRFAVNKGHDRERYPRQRVVRCVNCGQFISNHPKGRQRMYCDSKCRMQYREAS